MGSKLSSRCVRLGTICSADKEKDSTYSEVIHIVAWVETGPGTGEGSEVGQTPVRSARRGRFRQCD
jgi:hypothetical protein